MHTKNAHGGKICGQRFWFASRSTDTRKIAGSSIYENFLILKPTQVEALRGGHAPRIYKDRIHNIKYAFLRENTK